MTKIIPISTGNETTASSEFPNGEGATVERILGLEKSKINAKEQNCENQGQGFQQET